MSNILDEICARKRQHVATCKAQISVQVQLDRARAAAPARGFADALEASVASGRFGLIAELKKASPSHGLIRAEYDPSWLAEAYRDGGASCLSVLTDTPYFQGENAHLETARAAVSLPALRKDFNIDPYQIIEARAIGADCILIIMAVLEDTLAAEMKTLAEELGMDVLIEVHDEAETERALALSPRLLGVNKRNLTTLATDLSATEKLGRLAGDAVTLVSESGLSQLADLQRMANAGANCFLVGEGLMRNDDVQAATRTLLGLDAGAMAASQ
jgi:indole-3-glycerol phosphate synthase